MRYRGSRVHLTPASQLVLGLADSDSYRLLVDGLRMQCTLRPDCERRKTNVNAKLDTCTAILNSVSLRRFASLMLQVGNIVNEVAFLTYVVNIQCLRVVHLLCFGPLDNTLMLIIMPVKIVVVLLSWHSRCVSSLSSCDEFSFSAKWPPQTKPTNLGCESAISCYRLHPPSPFIIITQPEGCCSFHHLTEAELT